METVTPFTNPAVVSRYADITPQRVPGYVDLHRMAVILLSERVREAANILVLGAGGGLELKSFAEARPGWSFVGVDPSRPMLDLAERVTAPYSARVRLVHGYIDDTPCESFDGATCLLTLHFLSLPERLRVLRELRLRMKHRAPLVMVHHSKPPIGDIDRWLERSLAFAAGAQPYPEQTAASAAVMAERLPLLSADDEEAVLRQAGFSDPTLFYASFSFRGWVAYAEEA